MDPEDDYKPRKEGVGFPTFPGKTREWEAWEPEEIDEKKLKAVLKTILKESNLELDQLHKISEGEWEAYAVNRLGNRVGIIIWTKYMPFVEKEDVEDLYEAMLEYKLQHAVFITTSHFTKNAQEFAEDLPIELVDGRNLGELVPEAELYEVEDVFVTDKGNQEAVDYFKTRRKKKLLGIIGDAETIEYIDRRYLPFAVYTIGKPKRPQEEESKNLFVDLSTAEIPYVEERNLMVVCMVTNPISSSKGVTNMGRLAPATSAKVGSMSPKYETTSLTVPAGTCPGHQAIIGSRMPPSYRSRLYPRSGPLVSK